MDNKRKGLTLVEVLVSAVLTSMVVLYATSFFVAAFRLSTEEKEYSSILEDVANNLESYKFKGYDSEVGTAYVTKTKTIRDGKYTVEYDLLRVSTPIPKSEYIISKASWKYGGSDESAHKISIKTAICGKWDKK